MGVPRVGEEPHRRRLSDRLRFGIERLLLRGVGYRLLLAAFIIAFVALLAGLLALAFDDDFSGPAEALWWAFLRLTDPGYLGDDQGVARRSISTVVTVIGYVLFLGLLVAILTQWLNQLILKLESGTTPVALSDHVIILGWTERTPKIVAMLLRTPHRVERFLERQGARELRIVILAEQVDGALVLRLREKLGDLWNDRQVLLRAGSPLQLDHLERVAFRTASVVILPGAEFAESHPEHVDAETIKTLMSVSEHARSAEMVPPRVVAGVSDAAAAALAQRAYRGDSEIVAADELISCLIAQSIRQSGIFSVYSELLDVGIGNAIYIRSLPHHVGAKLHDIGRALSKAVLIGRIRAGARRPELNPGPEAVLEDGELLVFIARRFSDCAPDRPVETAALTDRADAERQVALPRRRRVLVMGWSREVPALLRELGRYGQGEYEVDVVSSTPLAQREQELAWHRGQGEFESVHHIEANLTAPGVLEGLRPQAYDNVLLLASERLDGGHQADAATATAYLTLDGVLPDEGPRPEIFVELMHEENRFLFTDERDDVMVTPTFVGYLLSQVSMRPELAGVFNELTSHSGVQIELRPVSDYVEANASLNFDELSAAVQARKQTALGWRRAEAAGERTMLNPERGVEWQPEPSDQVVILLDTGDFGVADRSEETG
jgi:hypothetical protein